MITMHSARPGFSLTELMVYLAIVGILASGIFGITKYIARAKRTTTETLLRTVKTGVNFFRDDTGLYPNTLHELVEAPGQVKNWKGPYLDSDTVLDGWKHEIQYILKSQKGKDAYDLYSYGPNGEGSDESEWIRA